MQTVLTITYWKSVSRTMGDGLRRFPREALFALLTTITASLAQEVTSDARPLVETVAHTSAVMFILSLGLTVLRENGRITALVDWIVAIALTGLVGWVVSTMQMHGTDPDLSGFVDLVIVASSVAVLTFSSYGSVERFWNTVIRVFSRALLASFFGSILLLGLYLILLSVRALFEIAPATWTIESHLSNFTSFLFTPLFFLAGFPTRTEIDAEPSMRPAYRALVLYVLAPLVILFTVILYAFAVKILIVEPNAVLSASTAPLVTAIVLAILFSWPVRAVKDQPWRALHRWMLPAALPLLAITGWNMAVLFQRDGIQEYDHFLASLLVALALTAIHATTRRGLDPRVPFIALAIVFLPLIMGPLSARSVSQRSAKAHGKETPARVSERQATRAASIDSVRTSVTPFDVIVRSMGTVRSMTFRLSESTGGDTLISRSSDGQVSVHALRTSSIVTVIDRSTSDTLRFDAVNLLGDGNDSLRTVRFDRGSRSALVVPSDVTLIRLKGTWSISNLTAVILHSQ